MHMSQQCGQDYHRIWPAGPEEVLCEAQVQNVCRPRNLRSATLPGPDAQHPAQHGSLLLCKMSQARAQMLKQYKNGLSCIVGKL